ncbi:MAG: acylphosphatase [Planctomycetes bacterium]|nr:acylphosphatase [Planctomycetota bacterium]
MPRLAFVVTGRVQGVGFRASARDAAARLGVAGFVRNRDDGAVEGEAEGDEATLAQFVAWLRQGPPWGRVDGVETWPLPDCGGDGPFAVRR